VFREEIFFHSHFVVELFEAIRFAVNDDDICMTLKLHELLPERHAICFLWFLFDEFDRIFGSVGGQFFAR
jgi:hypothetical protein